MGSSTERTAGIEAMYDEQASTYAGFKERSFSWLYIEKPAFDKYLSGYGSPDWPDYTGWPNMYRPGVKVLDIGCGAGLLTGHLISKGILPDDITGIDISANLLAEARKAYPHSAFFQVDADDFRFPPASFDLVVSNMVYHYMDDEQMSTSLGLAYDVLKQRAPFLFVDANPDYNAATLNPENVGKWLQLPTPWGGAAPWFNRDPFQMYDIFELAGFEFIAGGPLPVAPEGKDADPAAYGKYIGYPARMANLFIRLDEPEKQRRIELFHQPVPSLT